MSAEKREFKINDNVVYPSHGVGVIKDIEKQEIGGMSMELFVIFFEKEKLSMRVPIAKAKKTGLRHIISSSELKEVYVTLQDKPKSSKGMWSRRAAEYEAKINSGKLSLIAEVVRDLHKNVNDPDRSYSERVIYESALNRLSTEVSVLEHIDLAVAEEKIVTKIRDYQLV